MKKIVVTFLFLLSSAVWAGGDLPFPLDEVKPISSPEEWRDPSQEFKVICKLGQAHGQEVLVVRVLDLDGMLLDQKATFLIDGQTSVAFQWGQMTLRFVRGPSGKFASLQIDGQSWRSLERSTTVVY